MTVGFHNADLGFAFDVVVDFSNGFSAAQNPANVDVRLLPSLCKKIKPESILKMLEVIKPGWKFFKTLVMYIDSYCDKIVALSKKESKGRS